MKKLETVKIDKIRPYKNNPRKNEEAVDSVVESIKQCSYVSPIVVDENYEILAGHTRYKALEKLGRKEIEVLVVDNLTEEQKTKYRILDNKTNELAGWDWDKLDEELQLIDFGDFDFGFTNPNDTDIDKLFEKLDEPLEKKKKVITCPHCGEEIVL